MSPLSAAASSVFVWQGAFRIVPPRTGIDTNFRVMAGMTNALANCVEALVRSPTFPTESATIGAAQTRARYCLSVPIRIGGPVYEITTLSAPVVVPHN